MQLLLKNLIPWRLRFAWCALVRGGHAWGRWWWPDRPEATGRFCADCSALQTPSRRRGFWWRSRAEV